MSRLHEIIEQSGHKIDRTYCPPTGHLPTWYLLQRTPAKFDKEGEIKEYPRAPYSRHNLAIILENDPKYKSLQYCQHSDRILFNGKMLEPADLQEMALDMERDYRFKCKDPDLRGGIVRVAYQNVTEPVKEWQNALAPWDGERRIFGMFTKHWGVAEPATEREKKFVAMLAVRWMVSCVARIQQPGCDMHTVLTLVGPKGMGKSRGLRALCGRDWFSDSNIDITTKAAYELLHQSLVWIWELAEMHALHGRSANNAKMFLTSAADRYRPTYGTTPVHRNRRTVFVATTNDYQFLSDGPERRFWPLSIVRKIDVDWIIENRDQLWAEALHLYNMGTEWHLPPSDEQTLEEMQQGYIIHDPWVAAALSVLKSDDPTRLATTDAIMDALEIPIHQRNTGYSRRISQICRDLGYKDRQLTGGKRIWVPM